jgi:peroxiredoxin
MSTALLVFGLVLPWLLVGLSYWLGFQLVRQNGRLLLRLESLEARLDAAGRGAAAAAPAEAPPAGLPPDTEAPEFELPDLDGRRRSLSEFRGRKVLLVFFGPQCGYCHHMLPRLAELARGAGGRGLLPLVVSNGTPAQNREIFGEYGVTCPVLIQKQLEVASKYQSFGTPIGYLIDERGMIASPQAVGAEALLALADGPGRAIPDPKGVAPNGKAKVAPGNRPLSTSRLVRDGLRAGTPAPDFRLPRVDVGEMTLDAYRGRRVLLVFSDPQCGPCDALAPQLEALHRTRTDLQVLMISRRDREANRKKMAEHGLTFPVALQKNWDTSRAYGMFATPIGYLIDERGVIAADVARGAEATLALASLPTAGGEGDAAFCLEGAVARPPAG